MSLVNEILDLNGNNLVKYRLNEKKNGTDLAHLQMASGLENHENIGMYQHFISLAPFKPF